MRLCLLSRRSSNTKSSRRYPSSSGSCRDFLTRADVDTIYVCTDSGREGEYIYRLVEQQAGVKGKNTPPRMDRLPDRRRDPARDPRSKRLKRIRQPGSFRLLKSERRLPDGNQLLPPPDIKIRQQHLQLPEYEIFRRIRRPCYDLRPRHGRAQRTGDPGIRRDPVLQSPKHHRRERTTFEGEWRAVKGSKWFESFDLYKENGFKRKGKGRRTDPLSKQQRVRRQPAPDLPDRVHRKERKKRRTRRYYSTWPRSRMNVPSGSRSARMRPSGSSRNYMKKSSSPTQEQMPVSCRQQWQKRSTRT